MNILYTAHATASGDGRNGHVRSSDGLVDTDVRSPVELGGSGGATNPEQLFAAGYAACYLNALLRVARRAKATVDGAEVTADVDFGPGAEGTFQLGVTLRISIPGLDPEQAQALAEAAHKVCPYSNATRGNIPVELVLE